MLRLLKRLWQRKPRPFLLDNKYRVIPAFELHGITYYQFDNAFEVPSGRALTALTIYEEFNQRCDKDYLMLHCQAVDKLLGDPKKINLSALVLIHHNLKERLEMVQLPEHIYKLASVMFFDKTESPYSYDFDYNNKKIKSWKEANGTLDFFLKQPFKDLMPSTMHRSKDAQVYFNVAESVNELHLTDLQDIISKKA